MKKCSKKKKIKQNHGLYHINVCVCILILSDVLWRVTFFMIPKLATDITQFPYTRIKTELETNKQNILWVNQCAMRVYRYLRCLCIF